MPHKGFVRPLVPLLFLGLLIASLGYSWRFGGRTGQQFVAIYLGGYLLSFPAQAMDAAWIGTQWPIAIVDSLCLAAMTGVALNSPRHFPLWAASFQMVTVLTHLATIFGAHIAPKVYNGMSVLWSVLILVAMIAGIEQDRRSGIAFD